MGTTKAEKSLLGADDIKGKPHDVVPAQDAGALKDEKAPEANGSMHGATDDAEVAGAKENATENLGLGAGHASEGEAEKPSTDEKQCAVPSQDPIVLKDENAPEADCTRSGASTSRDAEDASAKEGANATPAVQES